jgi:NAD dependent epimerase/dehydratase family enzyme
LLLGGQRVLPRAVERSGFRFLYPRIETALAAILGQRQLPIDARVTPAPPPP